PISPRRRLPAIRPLRYNSRKGDLLMARRTNRVAWGLIAVLAAGVLGGVGLLGVWLRAFLIARYRGQGANLPHAVLFGAPLAEADLTAANLDRAILRNANLYGASLFQFNGRPADLTGADLTGANLETADLSGAQPPHACLAGRHLT